MIRGKNLLRKQSRSLISMRSFNEASVPLPISDILAPKGVFDLEIGCGVGLHPIKRSLDYPNKTLVAIERTSAKFDKFYRRWIAHGKMTNLIPVHDDAIFWITHRVAPKTLSEVFILYPNPEPGNKNQRFGHMPFMNFLKTRMISQGRLSLATNIQSYAKECEKELPCKGWKLVTSELYQKQGRTHFERKYLERGMECFNLVFEAID